MTGAADRRGTRSESDMTSVNDDAADSIVDRGTFDQIKAQHGQYSSWAVWAEASRKPKSNIGDMSLVDPDANPILLQSLSADVVMIGLNISRPVTEPFRNFHDPSPWANDFKIRYAFAGTRFWGAYMTDFLKDFEMVESTSVIRRLKQEPKLVVESVERLLAEVSDLQCISPTILAFGAATHQLVANNVPPDKYARLVGLTHYSYRMSKERYRHAILKEIEMA
jgi:hypothetical protein